MNDSPQHVAAFRILDRTGIWKSNYAPPVFRLLWRLAVNVSPPHFMSFFGAAALAGIGFGVVWGLFMLLFFAASGGVNLPILLWASIAAGVMFGLTAATYYAYGRRRHQLPKGSALPQDAGDA
jgi:hypothetical protein